MQTPENQGQLTQEQLQRIQVNRECAVLRKSALQLQRFQVNREYAVLRKSALKSLQFPPAPANWKPGVSPQIPADFTEGLIGKCDVPKLLQMAHSHPRDRLIKFFPDDHRYEVCGRSTLGSVTGLVHKFANKFDPDDAIKCMVQGRWWPRPDYMTIDGRPMSSDEIKAKWKAAADGSARAGTLVHYLFELFLNREPMRVQSTEVKLFLKFLSYMVPCMTFRTEWEVFDEELRLAGSIDFVAKALDGSLIIVDWKRSKGLRAKYANRYRNMLSPLNHLPDCSGVQYRLQLNLYRYLLESHYDAKVSAMFIVCVHPDCGDEPFVDQVPEMQSEVDALLDWQRRRVAEAAGAEHASAPVKFRRV